LAIQPDRGDAAGLVALACLGLADADADAVVLA
jgi:hypothetical protein